MTLYLIGIGLENEKDITVKGLEIIKKAALVYVENYTSLLQCSIADLEKFYKREIILADRKIAEQTDQKIVNQAKEKDVAFLVIGDPLSATTHIELYHLAKEQQVPVKVIHNASILTAVGETGLQLYKFGRITSIPFLEDVPQLETPYRILQQNRYLDLHTLFLLDLKSEQQKFMTINEALTILQKIEEKKAEGIIKPEMLVIGCARLGTENPLIKAGKLKNLISFDFGKPPHCLIIPSKLHFIEEEMLKLFN